MSAKILKFEPRKKKKPRRDEEIMPAWKEYLMQDRTPETRSIYCLRCYYEYCTIGFGIDTTDFTEKELLTVLGLEYVPYEPSNYVWVNTVYNHKLLVEKKHYERFKKTEGLTPVPNYYLKIGNILLRDKEPPLIMGKPLQAGFSAPLEVFSECMLSWHSGIKCEHCDE